MSSPEDVVRDHLIRFRATGGRQRWFCADVGDPDTFSCASTGRVDGRRLVPA